jgi:hypothetical protein
MLNPFVGGLATHLSRYNRHLVLGRRSGGTAEGLLVTRLSLAELPVAERQQLGSRCYEVVGMDRNVKSLGGVVGSDLAGVALLNHFLIDYDAVVDWALGLRDRRRIARQDGEALRRDPVPADVGMAPLDAAWRLALVSGVADADGATWSTRRTTCRWRAICCVAPGCCSSSGCRRRRSRPRWSGGLS